jgi:hypothetical protein
VGGIEKGRNYQKNSAQVHFQSTVTIDTFSIENVCHTFSIENVCLRRGGALTMF